MNAATANGRAEDAWVELYCASPRHPKGRVVRIAQFVRRAGDDPDDWEDPTGGKYAMTIMDGDRPIAHRGVDAVDDADNWDGAPGLRPRYDLSCKLCRARALVREETLGRLLNEVAAEGENTVSLGILVKRLRRDSC
jgi:hypothetical protein